MIKKRIILTFAWQNHQLCAHTNFDNGAINWWIVSICAKLHYYFRLTHICKLISCWFCGRVSSHEYTSRIWLCVWVWVWTKKSCKSRFNLSMLRAFLYRFLLFLLSHLSLYQFVSIYFSCDTFCFKRHNL